MTYEIPHFLRCIEMAKLEKKHVLPNHWFAIKITEGTGLCAWLSVKRCPHAGSESRHSLERSFLFIHFFWRFACSPVSSDVPNEMPRGLRMLGAQLRCPRR